MEHRSVHNRYGLDYHQATVDGLYRRGYKIHGSDGDRPFVLSRAFFPGVFTCVYAPVCVWVFGFGCVCVCMCVCVLFG